MVWSQFRPSSGNTGNTGNTGRKRAKKGFFARLFTAHPGASPYLSVPIRTHPYFPSPSFGNAPPSFGSAVPRRKLLVIPVIPVLQPVLWKCPSAPRLRRKWLFFKEKILNQLDFYFSLYYISSEADFLSFFLIRRRIICIMLSRLASKLSFFALPKPIFSFF